jgi:Uma2 family endonuclease
MTLPAEKRRFSVDDYLRIERDSLDKHEFHDGEILAMSGGSPMHSLIALNLNRQIANRLTNKRCRAFESNLRLRIGNEARYVYADGSVVCGPLELDPAEPSARRSPTHGW